MHIFCHRRAPYAFEDHGASDWMARDFFTAGIVPSGGLPRRLQQHLHLEDQWRWRGLHYQRTANARLARMDSAREALCPILAHV